MSTLAVMSALVVSCHIAMHPEQVARLSDYATVESHGNTLAINLNGRGGGEQHASTMDEAIAIATRLIAAGRSVDLGILQLNSQHIGEPGMPQTVAEALEPCANIQAGAAVLAAADRQASCIYNTGKPGCFNGYPEKIIAASLSRMLPVTTQPQPVATPASTQNPPKPSSEDIDLFATARLHTPSLMQIDDNK